MLALLASAIWEVLGEGWGCILHIKKALMMKRSRSIRMPLETYSLLMYSQMKSLSTCPVCSADAKSSLILLGFSMIPVNHFFVTLSIFIAFRLSLHLKVDDPSRFLLDSWRRSCCDLGPFWRKHKLSDRRVDGSLTAPLSRERGEVPAHAAAVLTTAMWHAQTQKSWLGSCPVDFYKGSVGGRRIRLSELCVMQ